MLGMLLGSFLLLGLVHSFSASLLAFRTIGQHYQLLQDGSHALGFVGSRIRSAGFPNLVTSDFPTAISADSFTDGENDVLILEGWSRHNCFGNPNPQQDAVGRPTLYFMRQRFRIISRSLRWLCDYGATRGSLVRQSNNQSLIDEVTGFTLSYQEDSNLDGNVDTSVRAGGWIQIKGIQQLKLSLQLETADSSLQRVYQTTVQLRNPG